MISVTQLPFERPVVLRPILSNSLPLSTMSFSALERLSEAQCSMSHLRLQEPTVIILNKDYLSSSRLIARFQKLGDGKACHGEG